MGRHGREVLDVVVVDRLPSADSIRLCSGRDDSTSKAIHTVVHLNCAQWEKIWQQVEDNRVMEGRPYRLHRSSGWIPPKRCTSIFRRLILLHTCIHFPIRGVTPPYLLPPGDLPWPTGAGTGPGLGEDGRDVQGGLPQSGGADRVPERALRPCSRLGPGWRLRLTASK